MAPGFVRMGSEIKKSITGEQGYGGREYTLNEVASKTLGLRVRSVDLKQALPYTMREFSERWRNASTHASIIAKKSPNQAEIDAAAEYRDAKHEELKRDYAQFKDDARLLGLSRREIEQAAKDARIPEDLR